MISPYSSNRPRVTMSPSLTRAPTSMGCTMRDPVREVTFIGVARTRKPMRQRSTLAHELAHVLFGDWNDGEDLSARSIEEIRADAFARHLLVPGDGLREFLGPREAMSEADLSAVVQWFLVSPAIAAIALHGCGYIDTPTKCEWMAYSTPHWRPDSAGATSINPFRTIHDSHPLAAAAAGPLRQRLRRRRSDRADRGHA